MAIRAALTGHLGIVHDSYQLSMGNDLTIDGYGRTGLFVERYNES
ncbi:MAG: hypothetical protein U5Q03_18025 [Bacteroidota bacterium]|nr:hypothetical protein [Bacteroidota bacterium]